MRDSVEVIPSQETCKPCHPLALCPLNATTLPTMILRPGAWRLSPFSHMHESCTAHNVESPCSGGGDPGTDGDGYCRSGLNSGFRCEVCASGFYFDAPAAECARCRSVAAYVLVYGVYTYICI